MCREDTQEKGDTEHLKAYLEGAPAVEGDSDSSASASDDDLG